MSNTPKKVRFYQPEYLKYGFVKSVGDDSRPQCLLCSKSLSNDSMRPSKLKYHLNNVHSEHKDKDEAFFRKLRDAKNNQTQITSMFKRSTQNIDDGVLTSYYLSLIIAKQGLPHTIGEKAFIPAIRTVLEKVLHIKNISNVLRIIPLSNNTVKRRIDEMGECVEKKLITLMCTNLFSIQVDESTLPGNKCLLLVCVRMVVGDKTYEELAISQLMETHSTGQLVFNKIKNYFESNKIPLENIIGIATDGAPSMVGRHVGLITFFKKVNPNLFTIHCVIHRQHLVAKKLSNHLHTSLNLVIKAVNKIKRHGLQTRLFKELCNVNEEEFDNLILHTEVRWLSKGNCLERFLAVFDTVIEFFSTKNSELSIKLQERKNDIAYLSDLYGKFNVLNKLLQGKNLNLIKVKASLTSFTNKLELFERNFKKDQFCQFSSLENLKQQLSKDEVEIYKSHLKELKLDMVHRFKDIFQLNVPNWIVSPFEASLDEVKVELQEKFIELVADPELKLKFLRFGYERFWLQEKVRQQYPDIWEEISRLFIAFPSSYVVEKAFSSVINVLNKRSNLDISKGGDLRLYLTELKPNIEMLASSHQAHPSH